MVDFLKTPSLHDMARASPGRVMVGLRAPVKRAGKAVAAKPTRLSSQQRFGLRGDVRGRRASRRARLFDQTRRRSALVFIDEIDALGPPRGAGLGGGHDELEQTLNQFRWNGGFSINVGVIDGGHQPQRYTGSAILGPAG
jgi:hypothetical protein